MIDSYVAGYFSVVKFGGKMNAHRRAGTWSREKGIKFAGMLANDRSAPSQL
jgi:hypothetical protein